jgi:hypothetical protein
MMMMMMMMREFILFCSLCSQLFAILCRLPLASHHSSDHSTDHAEQRRPPRHSREHKQPRARVGTSWTHRSHRPRSPTTTTTASCRLVQGWAGAAPTVRCVDAGCLRTALRASAYTCLRLTRAKPEVIAWRQREVSRYGWVAARAFIIVLPCTAVEIAW